MKSPWFGILVICHVQLRASYQNFGLVSIEGQSVLLGLMYDDVNCCLESPRSVREEIGIICDTDSGGANEAKLKVKLFRYAPICTICVTLTSMAFVSPIEINHIQSNSKYLNCISGTKHQI